MKHRHLLQLTLVAGLTTSAAGQTAPAGDWPQWHGPDRTNLSREAGLAAQWPASGPPIAWSVGGVGAGYGTVAIKGDRIFVQGSAGGRSVVYTLNQARRGALKSGFCVQCHGDNFVGGPAPELAGPAFATAWNGRTVSDLFDLIRLTMPDDDPGALSREVYADLVAYILAVNKYPAGETEIGIESGPLKLIRIDASKP